MKPARFALRSCIAAFALAFGLAPAAALAHDLAAPPDPPAAAPAVPAPAAAPARKYPPRPPRFEGQPPPFDYPFGPMPAPAVAGAPSASSEAASAGRDYRGVSLTAAIGPGGLYGPGEDALALSYQYFRLGLGIASDLAVSFAFEGVGTSSVNPKTNVDSWLKQEIWSFGLQRRVYPKLYLRGGIGIGSVSEKSAGVSFSGGRGFAALGALGYDLYTRGHVAVALELGGTFTHYPRESWKTLGLQMAVSLF